MITIFPKVTLLVPKFFETPSLKNSMEIQQHPKHFLKKLVNYQISSWCFVCGDKVTLNHMIGIKEIDQLLVYHFRIQNSDQNSFTLD